MPRPYDMRRRAAAAEDTRRRIIDAAHRLLADQNGGRLRVHEVARAAGVSRATLYNRVGPRRSLLAAVFRDQGRLIGYGRVQEAMADRDAVRALDATVRESCRAWSVIRVAIRRTLALAALDREVGRLVGRYEASRWAGLSGLVSRLGEQGALAPGIDNETGTAALALLTSFQSYDQLWERRGHDAATEQLAFMAGATLLEPDPQASTGRS